MNTHVLTLASVIAAARAAQSIDVYWNISNPIFSGGYGSDYENIIVVNQDTHPYEYDQVIRVRSREQPNKVISSCELFSLNIP